MGALPETDPRYNLRCWIVRRSCGCITGICVDEPDFRKDAARICKEWIEEGLRPENVLFRDAQAEETFFRCPHKTAGRQLELA